MLRSARSDTRYPRSNRTTLYRYIYKILTKRIYKIEQLLTMPQSEFPSGTYAILSHKIWLPSVYTWAVRVRVSVFKSRELERKLAEAIDEDEWRYCSSGVEEHCCVAKKNHEGESTGWGVSLRVACFICEDAIELRRYARKESRLQNRLGNVNKLPIILITYNGSAALQCGSPSFFERSN